MNFIRTILPLVFILCLAFVLGLINIGERSLWFDEGFSLALITHPEMSVPEACAQTLHPPLYFALLKAWQAISPDVWWLRLFSVLCFLLMLAGCYMMAQELMGSKGALATTLLVALSPYAYHFSQELRMYALFAALICWAAWGILSFLRTEKTFPLIVYSISSSLALYTHYYALFFIFAVSLFVLFLGLELRWRFREFLSFVAASAGIFFLFIPWLSTFFFHLLCGGYEFFRTPPPSLNQILIGWSEFFLGLSPFLVATGKMFPHLLNYLFLLFLFILMVLGTLRRASSPLHRFPQLIILLTLIPVVLAIRQGSRFYIRYLLFLLPFVHLTIIQGLMTIDKTIIRRLLLLLIVLFFSLSLQREVVTDLREATLPAYGWLAQKSRADDLFVHQNAWSFFPLRYYDRHHRRNRLLAGIDSLLYTHRLLLAPEEILDVSDEVLPRSPARHWLIAARWGSLPEPLKLARYLYGHRAVLVERAYFYQGPKHVVILGYHAPAGP